MLTEILIVVALTIVNGLLAMSELAVVSSRPARLKVLSDQGSKGAATAMRLAEDPGRFLSTVQIGITLVGVWRGVATAAARATWFDAAFYVGTQLALAACCAPTLLRLWTVLVGDTAASRARVQLFYLLPLTLAPLALASLGAVQLLAFVTLLASGATFWLVDGSTGSLGGKGRAAL